MLPQVRYSPSARPSTSADYGPERPPSSIPRARTSGRCSTHDDSFRSTRNVRSQIAARGSRVTATMSLSPTRQRLHDLMRATLADEAAHHTWRYHAVRPMPVPSAWKAGQRVTGDCSKGVQFLARWANAPDPMQNGWRTDGNSQTIWLRLPHLDSPGKLEVGDIVLFGRDGIDHAAMVLEPGSDPLLWSFGHQGAPNSYRLSYDRRTKTYCKLPVVVPPPTARDKLRAKTGFYAWVAWRLGEGPWRHYGSTNKTVRPNVPRVIPLDWWKRYARFLANRDSGDKATTA